jgi:hypothetical protein
VSIEGMDRMSRDQFNGASPRIFTTDADHPMDGKIFVWAKVGWFERVEGPWGNVVFNPVAESEDELRNWISRDNPDIDLAELTDKYGRMVYQEFMENAEEALYPEAPETSSEEPFEEQDTT